MSRPPRLVVVTGTGTGVGKTWVAAALASALRARGDAVAARKPAQSFEPGTGPTDAAALAAATGEAEEEVCPPERSYGVPMAPPMAAGVLGLPVPSLSDLLGGITWPPWATVGIVEGAGGVASPIASDADTAGLVRALDPELAVVVSGAGLGCINDVRLAAAALGPCPAVVLLNRFDPGCDLHRRNLDWLAGNDGLQVATSVAAVADHAGPASADHPSTKKIRRQTSRSHGSAG